MSSVAHEDAVRPLEPILRERYTPTEPDSTADGHMRKSSHISALNRRRACTARIVPFRAAGGVDARRRDRGTLSISLFVRLRSLLCTISSRSRVHGVLCGVRVQSAGGERPVATKRPKSHQSARRLRHGRPRRLWRRCSYKFPRSLAGRCVRGARLTYIAPAARAVSSALRPPDPIGASGHRFIRTNRLSLEQSRGVSSSRRPRAPRARRAPRRDRTAADIDAT
ncbi:hypothetical protein EVAR_51629_1 [Eumeta japonica]|uniref:Uncharacterized protein n=1 Tax=Eumeta variegata TaxID=151549 RepID=A0A4C1YCX2_EUMVA|nr:hypothetical protein EVAR_51629_1 [Eumeta japonica]